MRGCGLPADVTQLFADLGCYGADAPARSVDVAGLAGYEVRDPEAIGWCARRVEASLERFVVAFDLRPDSASMRTQVTSAIDTIVFSDPMPG